jgi:hypothetical protein
VFLFVSFVFSERDGTERNGAERNGTTLFGGLGLGRTRTGPFVVLLSC